MKPSTPLEHAIEDALCAGPPPTGPRTHEAHPDALVLARYIDGQWTAADRDEVDRVEAHLAACDDCRELVTLARLHRQEFDAAGSEDVGSSTPWWLGPLRALIDRGFEPGRSHTLVPALAFAVVAALGLGLFLATQSPGPGPAADDGFASFVGDQGDTVRDADPTQPWPVSPRFDVVVSVRPSFVVRPPVLDPGTRIEAWRLLIVDEQENLVGTVDLDTTGSSAAGDEQVSLPYPSEFPALVRGHTYAWKVSARVVPADGGPPNTLLVTGSWMTSHFVPFRVAED